MLHDARVLQAHYETKLELSEIVEVAKRRHTNLANEQPPSARVLAD